MEIKEIWKTIEDYPNYQISSFGRVKSLNYNRTGKEQILKQGIFNNGYRKVVLSKENRQKNYLVHRLVATAFIPNPQNFPQVNHKDENPSNNCVDNVEWCTNQYNANYGTRNERVGKANSIALKGKKKSQEHIEKCAIAHQIPIVQIHQSGLIIGVYDSALQARKELGISNGNISSCCNGKRNFAGGFKWKYLNDYIKI